MELHRDLVRTAQTTADAKEHYRKHLNVLYGLSSDGKGDDFAMKLEQAVAAAEEMVKPHLL